MTQDGLLIAVTIGGEGNPSRTHPPPTLTRVTGQWAEFTAQGWGARPFICFSPVQTGLPRELAKLLTHATQPGLVSPGGGGQAQRHHPASLSSESGESTSSSSSPRRLRLCQLCQWGSGKRVVMQSLCAGDALDPPLWTVLATKALSESRRFLSLPQGTEKISFQVPNVKAQSRFFDTLGSPGEFGES